LHARYGSVVRISPDEVAISDPEGLATIHRIGSGFRKTDWYTKFTAQPEKGADFKGTIFTMTEPKVHAARRRLFARPFSRTFLMQHWHDTVREMTRFAVRRMKETAAGNDGKLDVLQWWTSKLIGANLIYIGLRDHAYDHYQNSRERHQRRAAHGLGLG
jgi:cytochrome P450